MHDVCIITRYNDKQMKNIALQKKRSYFEEDGDDEDSSLAISTAKVEDDDFDPLDAFMLGVQEQVTREATAVSDVTNLPEIVSGMDDFGDDDDDGVLITTENRVEVEDEYDSDGTLVHAGKTKARVEPLPAVDHSKIAYPPFHKNLYDSPELSSLSLQEVSRLRDTIGVTVSHSAGAGRVPCPVLKFSQTGLPCDLLKAISREGFEEPTAIQAQTLPVALSGLDCMALAKTGSGKTFAFVWPMIQHILKQPHMRLGDGPVGLVLSPTRELASQIYTEAKRFCKVFNIRVCPIFGGGGKWEMQQALKEAPEIVVATPGRLIELIGMKATNLCRCTMLVLDEADRMFDLGFEYQVRSIVSNIRPDRQTLMFSATMKKKIEGFAREILNDPVRIVVGEIGQANPDIRQIAQLVSSDEFKWLWLSKNIDDFVADGKVLIFSSSRTATEELANKLRLYFQARQLLVGVEALHGDKDQTERSAIVRKFSKSSELAVLVATDIASRGLDISEIRTVVNYCVPKNIDTYVHRIGRTGRMGKAGIVPGTAFTLVTPADSSFAVDLVHNLRLSSQPVAADLLKLAQGCPRFDRVNGRGGGKSLTGGSLIGLGFQPGFSPAPRIMTSSVTQEAAFPPSFDMQANPYIDGRAMGRGKHLTQPSWAASDTAASSDNLASGDVTIVGPPRKASRFSTVSHVADAAAESPTIDRSAGVLAGFVKSSSAYASMSVSSGASIERPIITAANDKPAKKSRWDT